MNLKARFIKCIGTQVFLRVFWGSDCPNCGGSGRKGYHDAKTLISISKDINDNTLGGEPKDHSDSEWPNRCRYCGIEANSDATKQVFRKRLYNTESGNPEPGDLYYADWFPENMYFDGQPKEHLLAVLPNGDEWDIDSRASNCTMPDDRNHRCWCVHGEPPDITVDKNGTTCNAGGGSIYSGDYHGFLINGEFTNC